MSLVQIMPWVAAACVVPATFTIAAQPVGTRLKNAWIFSALLCCLFVAWSLLAMINEGPLGFWVEHKRNLWGNQIFFDLLLAAGTAWTLIMPRAKALGMNVTLWLIFILCTGSIGLLAMLSRLLFLEEQRG